jgi:7,8-dihydropterin-6-yl-methyl-4-(beta-D-ribofuranosyl)aminobenzene 5'-phosphate synthase
MPKPIQIPLASMAAIDRLPAEHLHWIQQPMLLSDKIGITGPIPRETSFEDTGGPFYLDPQGKRADLIEDDLALWIRTGDGVIVCVGCSHAGLVNTLNHVRRLNHGLRVRAVIGGFHLLNAGRERLEQTITALRLFEPDMVVPCHCTGELAVAVLRNALGERVSPGAAGMTNQF